MQKWFLDTEYEMYIIFCSTVRLIVIITQLNCQNLQTHYEKKHSCASENNILFFDFYNFNILSQIHNQLSALLSVTSYTDFINDGNRKNCGIVEKDLKKIEADGIIIGLIGARLARRDLMEFQEIVIAKTQNNSTNGYGKAPLTNSSESKAKFAYRLNN